jgi:hypothetical protein
MVINRVLVVGFWFLGNDWKNNIVYVHVSNNRNPNVFKNSTRSQNSSMVGFKHPSVWNFREVRPQVTLMKTFPSILMMTSP